MAFDAGSAVGRLVIDPKEWKAGLNTATKEAETFQSKMKKVGQSMQRIGGQLSAAVTLPLVGIGTLLVKTASDAEETNSKFNAVFRDQSDTVREWAEDFSESVNRATIDNIGFLATIQDTLVPLGFARDAAGEMSKSVVELATDLASFNNLPTEQVVRDIQSAIVGNTETLRKYGVVASQSAIIQEALNTGLIENKNELDATSKAQAIYQLLIKGTTDAQGDAIRTADSFANQLRGTQANAIDLATSFGEKLIPIVSRFMSGVNDAIDFLDSLDDSTKELAVGLGVLAAAAGPVTAALGFLIANPVVAAVVGLTAGVLALNEAMRDQRKDLDPLLDRYEELGQKANRTDEEQIEYIDTINRLNKILPESAGFTEDYTKSIENNTAAIQQQRLELAKNEIQMLRGNIRAAEELIESNQRIVESIRAGETQDPLGVLSRTSLALIDTASNKIDTLNSDYLNLLVSLKNIPGALSSSDRALLESAGLLSDVSEETDKNTESTEENTESHENNAEAIQYETISMGDYIWEISKAWEEQNQLTEANRTFKSSLEQSNAAIANSVILYNKATEAAMGLGEELETKTSKALGNVAAKAELESLKMADSIKNAANEMQNAMSSFGGAASTIFGQIQSIATQVFKNQTIEAENEFERQKEIIEQSTLSEEEKAEKIAELEQEKADKIAEINKQQAEAQKAAAIIQSIIDTGVAVVKTLSSVPFPANLVAAGIIGGLGAAQTALIASQPIPEFAEGGVMQAGQLSLVGERGPELVIPESNMRIFSNEDSRAMMSGMRIENNFNAPINNAGNIDRIIERIGQKVRSARRGF